MIVPTANLVLTPPMVLVWLVGVVGGIVIVAVISAAAGVLFFGPRERDSLIIPAMASFGTTTLIVSRGRAGDDVIRAVVIGAAVGILAAAIQRILIVRWSDLLVRWPLLPLVSTVTAGATVGAFFGLFGLSSELVYAVGVAVLGGLAGGFLALRGDSDGSPG